MNDEQRIIQLEALGPVPGCEHHPAGLTRLLALRLQAISKANRYVNVRQTGSPTYLAVLVEDLGPVLMTYLACEVLPLEMQSVVSPGEIVPRVRGVVRLAPIGRLLPPALWELHPAPHDNQLPGALGMTAMLMRWVLAGELLRLKGHKDDIAELIGQATGLDPEWIQAYPELSPVQVPLPEPEPPSLPTALNQGEKLTDAHSSRRYTPRPRHNWIVADAEALLARSKALAALKDRKSLTETVLNDLLSRNLRDLPMARRRQADIVERLIERFPNFEPVCSWVADQLRLCAITRKPLRMPPTLLVGPPGVGKTMFCIELAEVLGASICMRSLAEASAAFLITGTSTQWAGGRPGVVAEHLSRCPVDRAPWFVFDELDKANGDRAFPVGPALLGMLEPYTAQRFRDEALEVEMDIRPATIFLTANDLRQVRPELTSRVHVIHVRTPTAFEMPTVVASVDAQLRKERPELAKVFSPLDTAVLLHLNSVAPRELRRVLQAGYASAIRRKSVTRGRRSLQVDDMPSVGGWMPYAERVLH